jgi:predicted Zn-dependent protease
MKCGIKIIGFVLCASSLSAGCIVCANDVSSPNVWVTYASGIDMSDNAHFAHKLLSVGNRLSAAIGTGMGDFKITLVSDPRDNAYCLSNGKIFIGKGLLELFKSDDEIACVLAHEMGHIVLGHRGDGNVDYERATDSFALNLMRKAGFDPSVAINFWTRYYDRIGWWGGTGSHLEPHERIEFLKTQIFSHNKK